MTRYLKFEKPLKENYEHNPNIYEGYSNAYNKYKSMKDTIVINEGKDDEYIFVNEESTGAFHITSVSREDFESRGWDASNLTDGDMERIASKMSDNYVGDGSFWEDIDFWAEEYGCTTIKDN